MKTTWLQRLEEGLIAFLLAAMTLITFGQVVARYVFNYSFVWALELTTWLFGGLIFLGISYGVRVGAHIGVDAVVKLLPTSTARKITLAATLLCIVYAAIAFVGGWVYTSKMYDIGILAQDLPVPQWIPRLVLPLGFALLVFRFIQVFARVWGGKDASLLGDEVADALKYSSQDDNNDTIRNQP